MGCDAATARTPKRRRLARAPTWYFAEGAQGFFSTYLLLANPQATANTAHVTYLPRERAGDRRATYPLAPGSRTTIDAGD